MKVVCIDKTGDTWLMKDITIGETYEVISEAKDSDGLYYDLKTKNGSICWLPCKNFMKLEDYREKNINEIIK